MIFFLQHNNKKITQLSCLNDKGVFEMYPVLETNIVTAFKKLAKDDPASSICWCHESLFDNLNIPYIQQLAKKQDICYSYHPYDTPGVDARIGYVEESLFIQVAKKVQYPTWQMSSAVGITSATTFSDFTMNTITSTYGLSYFLCSLAKKTMPKGLFCYSDPQLLLDASAPDSKNAASLKRIYPFVKQHYKKQWIFLLFFQRLLFDKRIDGISLLKGIFTSVKKSSHIYSIDRTVDDAYVKTATIDVIIPTMGRATYLYDVLQDFKKQSLLPARIIIIEQNAAPESTSELGYITTEKWPFAIEHRFIHQTGACNARNIALQLVKNDMVFFADDDIRFEADLLETAVSEMEFYGYGAVNFSCLQKGEKENVRQSIQWSSFGSGTAMVRSSYVKGIHFDMAYEHGHGEDADFGMQLRKKGCDIIYLPHLQLLHLKAPVGGFRTKKIFSWENDSIIPKPSPTVMYFKKKYATAVQLKAYQFMLFIKFYKKQSIKNPIAYLRTMKKAWNSSVVWSKKLPL